MIIIIISVQWWFAVIELKWCLICRNWFRFFLHPQTMPLNWWRKRLLNNVNLMLFVRCWNRWWTYQENICGYLVGRIPSMCIVLVKKVVNSNLLSRKWSMNVEFFGEKRWNCMKLICDVEMWWWTPTQVRYIISHALLMNRSQMFLAEKKLRVFSLFKLEVDLE